MIPYSANKSSRLLSALQSGLIPGDSCVNQLTFLYITFCKAIGAGKEVRTVFCDGSKVFDRVRHAGLIHKLKAAGVTGEVLTWFKSYLSNRFQRAVLLLGIYSSLCPQGSILGPILFILNINDIVHAIGSNNCLFADDISPFIVVDNPLASAICLNTDLCMLTRCWFLTFTSMIQHLRDLKQEPSSFVGVLVCMSS